MVVVVVTVVVSWLFWWLSGETERVLSERRASGGCLGAKRR